MHRPVYPQAIQSGPMGDEWKEWGKRVRVQMKERRMRPGAVAAKLGIAEPTLRSWLNGSREINLSDFVRLCAAVKGDPRQLLFGSLGLSAEQKFALGQRVVEILETDTAVNPAYPHLVRQLQNDINGKRGKKK